MFNVAQEEIFDRYKQPRHAGHIKGPTFSVEGSNPLCGDEVRIEGVVEQAIFTELKHSTRACAICTASTDLLLEELLQKPVSVLAEINHEAIVTKLGIPLSAVRLKCALLPLETLKQAQI